MNFDLGYARTGSTEIVDFRGFSRDSQGAPGEAPEKVPGEAVTDTGTVTDTGCYRHGAREAPAGERPAAGCC